MANSKKKKVVVLYNSVGDSEIEEIRADLREGEAVLHESLKGDEYDQTLIAEEIVTPGEQIEGMAAHLRKEGFDARAIDIRDSFTKLHAALTRPRPDVVFNLVEWFNDTAWQEDRVASLYDLLRIPYTGSPPFALAMCQRKVMAKQFLAANGLPTPKYKLVKKTPIPKLTGLRYPVIVKPSRQDASEGVTEKSVVEDREGLEERVRYVLRTFEQPALIEDFIAGRELGVSILGNKRPRVLPIMEMDFSELPSRYRGIISFGTKWNPLQESYHKTKLICPAPLPKTVQRRARELALRAYQLLGLRDYARVDMRLDSRNRLHILELNPNPDLDEAAEFMASARAGGLTPTKALRQIVDEALSRTEE